MKKNFLALICFYAIHMAFFTGCSSGEKKGSEAQQPSSMVQHQNNIPAGDSKTVNTENQNAADTISNVIQKENILKRQETSTKEKEQTEGILREPEKQTVTLRTEAKKFCDFFKTYDEPSQFYTVPALQTKEIKGNAGTVITVHPEDLTTLSNQPVEKPIEVELKELTKQEQLLRANAQTVCKGRLLVSGGAYYVNLRSEGQPLKLKPGKGLSIRFPQLTDAPMSLFAGYRDSLGQMQWQQRNQTFKSDALQDAWRDTRNKMVQYDGDILEIDTLPKRRPKQESVKEKQSRKEYEKLYAAMEVQSLGWINCDRFSNIPDKTNLNVQIVDPSNKLTFASIYLLFEGINSIMQTHYGATPNGVSNPGFNDVPVGAKVKLIAFSLKENKMFLYASDLTIKRQESVSITLKEANEAELKKLLGKAN